MENNLPNKCCQTCDFWKGKEQKIYDFESKEDRLFRKCANSKCQFYNRIMRHSYKNCITYKQKESQ